MKRAATNGSSFSKNQDNKYRNLAKFTIKPQRRYDDFPPIYKNKCAGAENKNCGIHKKTVVNLP